MSSTFHPTDSGERIGQLLVAARGGSAAAVEELLTLYRPYLLKVAGDELPQDLQPKLGASDLVQQTVLQVAAHIAEFAGENEVQLRVWLRRILLNHTHNVIRDFQAAKRRVHRERPIDVSEMPATRKSPSSWLLAQEERELLRLALAGISARHREIIHLRSEQALSFAAIGKRLACSEGAARKLWARAILALKRELCDE